jgi:heptosyltransferase-3
MSHAFKNIRRILVIKLRHIGDVLLTVPVFRALKETFPDADISALVNSGTEDVLRGNPLVDEVILMDRGIKGLPFITRYAKEIAFLKNIRAKGFDMTVDLTGGDRAAVISLASGAGYRLGWMSRNGFIGKRHFYTHLYRPDGSSHMVLQNLEVLKHSGISTENLRIDFSIPEDARNSVKGILDRDNPKGIVHIHPTSRWLFKCWRDEYMAEVIMWLLDNGNTVIVTSSNDRKEREKAKRILSNIHSRFSRKGSRLLDLCGKTTIKQLAAISEASDLFLGVDSAPMHIAAAVGTPVIALFGPSGAFSWGPWDNDAFHSLIQGFKSPYNKRNGIQRFGRHIVIQRDWDCIPCGRDGCNGSKISRCLEDIKPEEVIGLMEKYLKAS